MSIKSPFLPDSSQRFRPPLRSLHHEWFADVEEFVALKPTAKVLQNLAAPPDYYQCAGYLPIHRAHLQSFASSALHFRVEAVPSLLLVASFAGSRRVRTPHGELLSLGGGAGLLPTGDRDILGAGSSALISLLPLEVGRAAAAMAGQEWSGNGDGVAGQTFGPLVWPAGSPQAKHIHHLVRYIDRCAAVDPLLPVRLGLDDVLHRLVATLLDPSLLDEGRADRERVSTREGGSAFADLLAYIQANLDQPLRLSDLEARSHYSRRALQYAFREKLNSTPKQWIRSQRMKAAMDQLRAGEGRTTVQALALRLGYGSLSHFSTDFKREFGLSPSEVRRRPL
ncbi:MAG: AraC family transcriptional regulator [Cyanobacteriota bacterium]|nr:AraC family transcriptional regulator [Cyanobacteriota bacterium]